MRPSALAGTFLIWMGLALSAQAIPYVPPPRAAYEAPIDRALANISADQSLDQAQRERLLGRLNLLAFARDDAPFAYLQDNDEFHEAGAVRCSEAPRGMPAPNPAPEPKWGPNDLCAQYDYYIGPGAELPASATAAPGEAAFGRLGAAREHYQRALQLDPTNLRALLGLAYAQDRLGDVRAARRSLRSLIKLGLPQVSGPQSDWETHAVLSEAVEHLSEIAESIGDRAKVGELRRRLAQSRPMIFVTPIMAPLSDAPFERLINSSSAVAFDFAGTGDARAQGWLKPDAAWLVWDPQGRGEVRSGFDLIGARTWAVFWSDGFEALRSLDDNRDGELTGAELGGLALWRDANVNGVSDPGEVTPVAANGIFALAVRGAPTRAGLITAQAGLRLANGATRPLYDWTPGLDAPRTQVSDNGAVQLALGAAHP